MSRLFPHAPYAEDQPLARTILTTHCLHRGFTAGGVIGAGVGTARALYTKRPFAATVLRSTGVGAVVGTGLLAVGVTGRMWGREEIEWKDRSWRLLANEGQKNTDDGSLAGIAIALAVGGMAKGARIGGWRPAVGLGAIGSLVGIVLWAGFKGVAGDTPIQT